MFKPAKTISIGITNYSQPLQNGDAEIGDHRLWWIFGQNDVSSRIKLTSGGYGNSSYAFKHDGHRDVRNRGMLQKMDGTCFPAGSSWNITAKFRYFKEDGTPASCKKREWQGNETCPTFQMLPEGELKGNPLLNEDNSTMIEGEWNDIHNIYTVGANEYLSELHILVTAVNSGFNYELDNIDIAQV